MMRVWPEGETRLLMQEELRAAIVPGAIDVNIMAKIDREVLVGQTAPGAPLPWCPCQTARPSLMA